jgi:hypothetical protein
VLDLACGPGLVAGTSRLRGALPTRLHFAAAMIGLASAAHAEDLLRVLDTTGFAQIEAHKVNLEWRFAAAGDLIEGFRQGTVRTAALIGVQPASALPAIAVAIARGIAAYRGPDGFAVPMVALLASGVRSLEPDRDQRRKTAASSRCGVHMNWSTGVTRSRR